MRYLFVFLLFLFSCVSSQNHIINNNDKIIQAKRMLFPTVAVMVNGSQIGSGVLVRKNGVAYCITARHCIISTELADAYKEADIDVLERANDGQYLQIRLDRGNVKQFFRIEVIHIDEDYDFAIATISRPGQNYPSALSTFDMNLDIFYADIAPAEFLDSMYPLQEVVGVGYPNNAKNALYSSGTINNNWTNGGTGLDMDVYFGNSGGPVYDKENGFLIGIIYYVMADHIRVNLGPYVIHIPRLVDQVSAMVSIKEVVKDLP